MNVIPPNERSCGNTSFHVETTFRPKAAPFSSESGCSQRVVNSDSTKNLEARDKEESKNKIFCKIEVAQYCRRKYHSKGSKLQNGRIHQQQTNDCVLDDRDCIDSYKLYGNQDTRIGLTCNAGASNDSHEETKVPGTGNASSLIQHLDPPIMPFNGLLSESIICRNANGDSLSEAYPVTELVQVGSLSRGILSKEVASRKDAKIDDQHEGLKHGDLRCGGMSARSTSSQNLTVDSAEENLLSISSDLLTLEAEKHPSDAAVELKGHDIVNCNSTSSLCPRKEINLDDLSRHEVKEILADWDIQTPGSPVSRSGQECGNLLSHTMIRQESKLMDQISPNMDFDRERENVVELLGCYMHPAPVLSMLLTSRGEEVHVAVLCGCLEEKARTIFVYKIPTGTQRGGCPSFIGYTVMLPLMENRYKIELGTSSLQFTPDWQCLVFHNSIKAPSCREGSMDCLCSTCTSNCFGENALKVVRVKLGYVSLAVKLKTVESVNCVLVCESNHIVAVEESGSLHVWIMCANWSSCTEEFILANFDDSYHHILELKRIPKSPFLIIGHNGAGDFTLWDLSKRAILSRYSAPTKSVFHVLPIGAFSWDEKDMSPLDLMWKVT
ncbi:hypothetical protein Syun_016143 [Stephania yunnanensis]|uniref:Uncharacterized protein n=1 Tax=Stephania yunnanensis TaxID=152371 RepID=A0AAP0P4L0_9MAGN